MSIEQLEKDKLIAHASGLFDFEYYRRKHSFPSDVSRDRLLSHFLTEGTSRGLWPNPYFDPSWYLRQYPDVGRSGQNPLCHYALHGDAEGRRPSILFDPLWYRREYAIAPNETALAHYLRHRLEKRFRPIKEFDSAFYLGPCIPMFATRE